MEHGTDRIVTEWLERGETYDDTITEYLHS